MRLGNRIRRIRTLQGLSQGSVCNGIISTTHYSNVENGRYRPSSETLMLIAKRLNVPPSYLTETELSCETIQDKLGTFEKIIEENSIERIQSFIKDHQKDFDYISNLEQEIHFFLLYYLALIKLGKYEESKKFFETNILKMDLSEGIIPTKIYKVYLNCMGNYHYFQKQFITYSKFLKEQLKYINSSGEEGKINYNLALVYFQMYDYYHALKHAKKAKQIFLYDHEWEKAAYCYNLIAATLIEMHRFDEAACFIEKGMDVCKGKSRRLEGQLKHNNALLFYKNNNSVEALKTINESITIKAHDKNKNNLFLSRNLKIDILLELKDLLQSTDELREMYKIAQSENELSYCIFQDARIKYLLQDFESYEKLIEKSIKIFHQNEIWNALYKAASHYSRYLEENQKYKKAFAAQSKCTLAIMNISKNSIHFIS